MYLGRDTGLEKVMMLRRTGILTRRLSGPCLVELVLRTLCPPILRLWL